MYESIRIEKEGSVHTIVLNRPEAMNALNDAMRKEIRLALEDMNRDEEVRVVIITGQGDKAFCAGGDVHGQAKGFDAISGRARLRDLHRLLVVMTEMEKPIIAAVNGVAVGAGCNLALACDLIIAADQARFSEIFINLGFVSDFGGMYFLPKLVGLPQAKEMIFTGRMVDAQEAKEMGLINRIVTQAELSSVVMDLAQGIAKRSPLAIGLGKTILNRSMSSDLTTILDMEAYAQGICFQSDEHKRLLHDFINRKKK